MTSSDLGAIPEEVIEAMAADRLAPKEASLPPKEWMKKNLFSSVGSTILTVVFSVLVLLVLRGMLSFIFAGERQWDSTATNMRLLLAGGYPQSQFIRMWVTLGYILSLAGLSVAVWKVGGRMYVRDLTTKVAGLGGTVLLIGVLAPFSGSARIQYLLVGAALVAVALMVRRRAGDSTVSNLLVGLVAVSLGVGSLWVIPYGHHAFYEGELIVDDGTVQMTTKLPWTMMVVVTVVAYFVGRAIADRARGNWPRLTLGLLWLSSPVVVIWFILRDPDFDYGYIATTAVPIFLAYAIAGGLLMYILANPAIGEVGRIVAAVAVVAAAATFLTPMLQLVRILALMVAMFALAAPTFSGNRAARLGYAATWAAVVAVTVVVITAINSPSTVEAEGLFFTGGLTLTVIIAVLTMIFSFPLGVLLALARTSKMPIFRIMATVYIEFVRGIPLITVLIFFSTLVPLFLPENMAIGEIAAVTMGFALFSAAYLAENVRGGLQSIRRGQYEAAEALGMTTSQKTVFIILPQALRVSIPPLVGQTIATYKETSLLAIIGVFDLLFVGRNLIAGQTLFLGSLREQLIFVSILYWVGAYSMSRASQNLERKLGVGER